VRLVGNSLRPGSIRGFLDGLPLVFQRRKAKKFNAVYHFVFTGEQEAEATVEIADGQLQVREGLVGEADLRVTAQSAAWLKFLAGDRHIVRLLLTRKVKLKGSPRLLLRFGEYFPV
jgi:alkyl sulfatase BDS1-like metallo-beta-lactamase superfamily hydrolase